MSVAYLDTSALVKLVRTERETAALRKWLADRRVATSALARTELIRAAARIDSEHVAHARRVLATVGEIAVDRTTLDLAATLPPPSLRSLDAIHLASAMAVGADLDALVAYDIRLIDAARDVGLPTVSPR
jgi:predicted nucleic acid-binding protein